MRRAAQIAVVLVAVVAAVGASLPRDFHVERTVVVDAPADRVLPSVASLRRWQSWAPWARSDASAVHSFVGPESGAGARWQWSGPASGRGALTVVEASAQGVRLEGAIESDTVNTSSWLAFTPEGAGTRVTWTERGSLPPLGGFFRGRVEARLSNQLERGLVALKALVEREPPPRPLPPPSSLGERDGGLSPAP
ncbi:MAG: SRPBCC family protein [Myxococcaceae bacterium]|jgi:hypothetical protein|nr:SRPBCC family protein [Myxococcaceae bacterium]